jgi:hypothetical protein
MTQQRRYAEQTLFDPKAETAFIAGMGRVYMWMAGGMLTTALVAMTVAGTAGWVATVMGSAYMAIALLVVQAGLAIGIVAGIEKISVRGALSLFFAFSAAMGASLSSVFLHYDLGTVSAAFIAASATFAVMSIIGLTTRRDLSQHGGLLVAGLFGLLITVLVNAFLHSGGLEWVVSIVGVLLFLGLTAHDSQAIKEMTAEAVKAGDESAVGKIGVIGALMLYLDFINLFLFLLSLMGDDE